MAKKFWEGEVNMLTDWGGDASTGNLPLSGERVQSFIKESINSKVGYIGEVKTTSGGFYVLCRDAEVFAAYQETITEDAPFGDLTLDGVVGRFDAPFNYTMKIEVLEPEGGYKSALAGSTGNVIRFKAETQDNSGAPQQEGVTVTYRIKNGSGVESSQTIIYPYNQISDGVTYNLDGRISAGENVVTITVVGENTGISSMRRITYNLLDIYFTDRFDITKRYAFDSTGVLSIPVGYDLKGVGETTVYYYFDGNLQGEYKESNENPVINNANKNFVFTTHDAWMNIGLHTLQMYMKCVDTESKEAFYTPIYYREFIVENTPTEIETPYITRKLDFDYSKGILPKGGVPTYYGAKQFENLAITYAAYYNGKSTCNVKTYIEYPGMDMMEISTEDLPLVLDSFSAIKKQEFNLLEEGPTKLYLRAYYDEEYFEAEANIEIDKSDMNLTTSDEGVVLYLNAFGRSNDSDDLSVLAKWEYRYLNALGQEEVITTDFSTNEYVVVSSKDNDGNIIPPTGIEVDNCLEVDELPLEENEDYDFLIFNGEYYAWNREFDWSNTSGWSDGKLKLANGNAITINYKPFDEDKLATMKLQGATFEFEFETTNVYNDDAVICRICGSDNFAPGISIYAAGAELAISRDIVTGDGENSGYAKMVSTKYKAEESNRISFVITPDLNEEGYRNRILSIYVNGEYCGAYAYDAGTNFYNDSKIMFRGNKDAGINIYSIKLYNRALSSTEILDNFIYYRNSSAEKRALYERNNIVLESNKEQFDADKLKSSIPVMTFYQIFENEKIEDLHQEKKNKKLTRHFDVLYTNIQNPSYNFFVKCAYITPQGTSSMNYPVKNFRLYTAKDDRTELYVGSNIFLDGNPGNRDASNLNPEALVAKGKYAFKEGSIPVKCWCLKADFAESSSSHNTGTARYWNGVLKNGGYKTKAQAKAEKYAEEYPYDVRTCIDGFPIVLFYERLGGAAPEFQGKYNFNNDKSTEDVFGFTGGIEIDDQEVQYFYIGNEKPIIHGEEDDKTGEIEYACSWSEGGYTSTPDVDSDLYTSKYLEDGSQEWYMLRGKELLDNPKMECWELLNSVNELALFKTAKGFMVGDDDEKVGILVNGSFDGAFESRFPDCGDYFHTNSLRRFAEWLVSCRYLNIDNETGMAVPFSQAALPTENYYRDADGKLIIQSLTKQTGTFKISYPNYNFYTEVPYESISSQITKDGYALTEIADDVIDSIEYNEVDVIPTEKDSEYEYIKCGDYFYTWQLSNLLRVDVLPEVEQGNYDFVCVGGDKYYVWKNEFDFAPYYEAQRVDDTPFNRALKFAVEKYDHIEMDKMAAYYIYLMRFGGVDQTVKNSMLTTEGPNTSDPNSTLPSLWFFINYDNDTILGVKNDGRLVFDPYITRETKDGTGYVYAGRESTLWNNLEADVEFMEHVTEVDNKLTDSTSNPLYSLSYANALREYDTNQSDMWCERIYNKDAETKYIKTYVEGWTQKVDKEGTATHVYEDYLYDVQGSRSAHRKWWLGRRFNVFDSRFANANFRASLIKFRSTNLPAGSEFTIKSGEPVYYAWGHDNVITEMTPTALIAGTNHTFRTASAFNIGSYLELMGAANISTFDLRGCVGALTEIDVTGCYSPSVGTKMKEILVGDHTRTDLVNNGTAMKFSGLDVAEKLEVLDVTNIRNIDKLDGLNKLLNIRNVFAKGTSIANFTFADGCLVQYVELPSTTETLSLTRSSMIYYDGIVSEDPTFARLNNLTIDNCRNLMNDFNFVLNWVAVKSNRNELNKVNLNLQGINWVFDRTNYNKLFSLAGIGKSQLSSLNVRGNIEIKSDLTFNDIAQLKSIFGVDCFKEGSAVYIKAYTGVYATEVPYIYEGDGDIRIDVTTVGTQLGGEISVYATVNEIEEDGTSVNKIIEATEGIITMNTDNLKRDYFTIKVLESNNNYTYLNLSIEYEDEKNEIPLQLSIPIKKRIYPSELSIMSLKDLYDDDDKNKLWIDFIPSSVNDEELEGRGIFSVKWEIIGGSSGYANKVSLTDTDKEMAYIQAPAGFDGVVMVQCTVTRDYDGLELCVNTKEIGFKDPNTIITEAMNAPVYNILVDAGIIVEDETGYGKLNKMEAANVTIEQLLKTDYSGKKTSIFANHPEITSFLEFQYFTSSLIGQMPQEGNVNQVLIPEGFFAGCSGMREVAFPPSFFYANAKMFSGCTALESIYGAQSGYDEEKNPTYKPLSFKYIGAQLCEGCTQLKKFELGNNCEYIGKHAFRGCELLTDFAVPSIDTLEIVYGVDNNPFQGCRNINFLGSEYDGVSKASKCQVYDGALYEVNDDSITLIRLGKDTASANIINTVPVYACGYSMQYRREANVVIPENVILNGQYIFEGSEGQSIKLNCLTNNKSTNLFTNTNYGNNYAFASNETLIPDKCFYQNGYPINCIIPEGIKTIGSSTFYSVSNLKTITFPSTLESIGGNSFWLSNQLKTLKFNGLTPPTTVNGDFFNVTLDEIIVKPEAYEAFSTGFVSNDNGKEINLLSPLVRISHLFSEGYVRIIKDGAILSADENNIIMVGGLETTQESDYHKYTTDDIITDLNITLNGEVVGIVEGQYTTIYLGDNSMLFSGEGYNFTKGVYDDSVKALMATNGWFYDKRFEGIRNGKLEGGTSSSPVHTSMEFDLSMLSDTSSVNVEMGQWSQSDYRWAVITNGNGDEIMNFKRDNGFNKKLNIALNDDSIIFKYRGENSIGTGIDGLVVNTIGNKIYSDPMMSAMLLSNDTTNYVRPIAITLVCDQDIPYGTVIELVDNKGHEYRRIYSGETMYFTLPMNNFNVKANGFVTEGGKKFNTVIDTIPASFEGDFEIVYETEIGVETVGSVICVKLSDTDYYIDTVSGAMPWGSKGIAIEGTDVDDVMMSSANGFKNTNAVLAADPENEMFAIAVNNNFGDKTIKGYIPSYEEMLVVAENTDIDFTGCWTSETQGTETAWCFDGNAYDRGATMKYYIFGKKIVF